MKLVSFRPPIQVRPNLIFLLFAGIALGSCGTQAQDPQLPTEARHSVPADHAPAPQGAFVGGFVTPSSFSRPMYQEPEADNQPQLPILESPNYLQVQRRLAQGWNTWDVQSVITQVLLPDGLAIHIGLQQKTAGGPAQFLDNAVIGRPGAGAEEVFPASHSWDGGYTDLRLSWRGHGERIQSAHDERDLVVLVTPIATQSSSEISPTIVFSVDYLWNRPGKIDLSGEGIQASGPNGTTRVYCTGQEAAQRNNSDDHSSATIPVNNPYFANELDSPVGVSTGKLRSLAQVQAIIERQRQAYERSLSAAGKSAPIVDAIESVLGWNTVYEPEHRGRVVSQVSRIWDIKAGRDVLFGWDTLFAASMAAIGDRDLAYANAMETLRGETPQGFVPNYVMEDGQKSTDRSGPPVGSITVLGLYRRFHERWFLEDTFPLLLSWNRWWASHRDMDGYLTWGSDGDNQPANIGPYGGSTRQAAVYESGLDNSPMYASAVYNPQTHLLEYADVGLMSLYIADCDALAEIATILGKLPEANELRDRSARYRAKLKTMWSDRAGIFLNKDLSTGEFNMRLTPTNFYPLLAMAATPEQAVRMVHEHLLNPNEFWGKWAIPSIERSDPAFAGQIYWAGPIWGPMNYLVYLGLRNYNFPDVQGELAKKSSDLFFQDWTEKGRVNENYNTITGNGPVASTHAFYDWGALLAFIDYVQQTELSHLSRAQH
jgi:putative isomerase